LDELKFFATPLEEYGWIKHFLLGTGAEQPQEPVDVAPAEQRQQQRIKA